MNKIVMWKSFVGFFVCLIVIFVRFKNLDALFMTNSFEHNAQQLASGNSTTTITKYKLNVSNAFVSHAPKICLSPPIPHQKGDNLN